jgi:hypothetical protein
MRARYGNSGGEKATSTSAQSGFRTNPPPQIQRLERYQTARPVVGLYFVDIHYM